MQTGSVTSFGLKALTLSVLVSISAGCTTTPAEYAAEYSVEQASSPDNTPSRTLTGRLVSIPESDCEIRRWYNYQVVALPVINERWVEAGYSLEQRAKRAFDIRHRARINARYMMEDGAEALRQRDMAKYGNPDGPTFNYLVSKSLAKGMTHQQAWGSIIEASSRTDNSYNARCMDKAVEQD